MSELREIRERVIIDIKDVVVQNKEKVEDAYNRIMKLEYIARREGLLALEYEAESIPKETPLCNEIAEMIELIVSGTEPAVFEELMTLKFFTVHNYKGMDALLYFLYARSILMIQAAASSQLIEEFFCAIIPENLMIFEKKHMMWE